MKWLKGDLMMADITSPHNPLIKQTRLLLEKRRERDRSGLGVLEGIRLAEEAVAAGISISHCFFCADLLEKSRGALLLNQLSSAGVRAYEVPRGLLQTVADTETPQGIVCVFRLPGARPEELAPGLVVVCDGLQDPGNLGTLARACAALGGTGLVVAGGAVDPFAPKCVRAGMGSLFRLPVVREPDTTEALQVLGDRGFAVVVADARGEALPWEVDWRNPVALVIGNEGAGPSAAALARATAVVRIPMPGPAESLNAGVAGSLLLYEALRQRMAGKH